MNKRIDFFDGNDLRGKAINKALEECDIALEIDEEVPSYIEDKADEILYEWEVQQEIKETDELHSKSINSHIKEKIK